MTIKAYNIKLSHLNKGDMFRGEIKLEPRAKPRRYVLDQIESDVQQIVEAAIGKKRKLAISPAPADIDADYGINLTSLASDSGIKPIELSNRLTAKLAGKQFPWLEKVTTQGAYLNLRLEMGEVGVEVVNQVLSARSDYGKENVGHGAVVPIDMSSPNIAKRMGVGHLRSTIIGDAVANLNEARGYKVIKDNHIGDWGTQFGNLIVAVKKWGDEDLLRKSEDPIGDLQKLYVRFHDEAGVQKEVLLQEMKLGIKEHGLSAIEGLQQAVESRTEEISQRKSITPGQVDKNKVVEDVLDKMADTELEKEGRGWFLKLEQGDAEARRLWQMSVDMSLSEFQQVYDMLGVKFDVALGESFYEDKMGKVIEEIRSKGVGVESKGALVVDMQDKNLGVAIVLKSDGATVYMTRDLACAIYREEQLKAERAIYVVGDDQKLYFRQLFEILRRMGHPIGETSEHVYFGMITLPEGKMSTRKGRTVLLKDVIDEGLRRAREVLDKGEREHVSPEQREKIIRQIAIGALKWSDIGQDPKRSIKFDWDKALSLDGYSSVAVQYAGVRAKRILETAGVDSQQLAPGPLEKVKGLLGSDSERDLVKAVATYPRMVTEAQETSNPSKLAAQIYDTARKFNTLYNSVSVVRAESPDIKKARLGLVAAALQTLENGLGILGIEMPEAM